MSEEKRPSLVRRFIPRQTPLRVVPEPDPEPDIEQVWEQIICTGKRCAEHSAVTS